MRKLFRWISAPGSARKAPCDLLTAGIFGALAVMLAGGIMGAGPWHGGGNVMWSYEEAVIDADGSFSTTPEHYGGSEVVTYSLVVTDIKGAAPKCDCQLYSGTSDTIANGTKTGDTFTQITAKGGEQKSAEGKAFHPYMWATCVGTGTISTITVGVYSTGKM